MNSEELRQRIIQKAVQIIKQKPEGIRSGELCKKIGEALPEASEGANIYWTIVHLDAELPNEIYKPVKGRFRHVTYKSQFEGEKSEVSVAVGTNEDDFYEPFAKWLKEREVCSEAIKLGGNKLGGKWGTPDVIGINKAPEYYVLKHPTEVISAEIKTDTYQLVTAFGQACAYKLFSHTTYLVIPKESPEEDIGKVESLCLIFGIGLVTFNNKSADSPNFQILVTPIKHEPDMFYVHEVMKQVGHLLFK